MGAVTLRDIPGVPPAFKRSAKNDVEVLFQAVDPHHGLTDDDLRAGKRYEPDPDTVDDGVPYLNPPDLAWQSHGLTDDEVREVIDACVGAILTGAISPDSDFRGEWSRRLTETFQNYRSRRAQAH